jgi:hypothetical protein
VWLGTEASLQPKELHLANIHLDEAGVAEMDGARKLVYVARSEIVRVEIARGSGSERPWLALLVGVILLVIAIGPFVVFLYALRFGDPFPLKSLAAVAFVIPAAWLLDLSLRPRWYVRVVTNHGVRKLLPPRDVPRESLESFVTSARDRFGC